MMETLIKKISESVTRYAQYGKGSMFVITSLSNTEVSKYYDNLYPRLFQTNNVNVFDNNSLPLLDVLTDLDGCIFVNDKGKILDYGCKIKKTDVLPGHGTRHASALGISKEKGILLVILSSEEDGMIRIFKEGTQIAQINPRTNKELTLWDKLVPIITRTEIHVATGAGLTSFIIGLNPLATGAIFTGSWVLTKYGFKLLEEVMKK